MISTWMCCCSHWDTIEEEEEEGRMCFSLPSSAPAFRSHHNSFLFVSPLFFSFSLSQVAQWPEKEAEEQPMFSEEYDWWVTDRKSLSFLCVFDISLERNIVGDHLATVTTDSTVFKRVVRDSLVACVHYSFDFPLGKRESKTRWRLSSINKRLPLCLLVSLDAPRCVIGSSKRPKLKDASKGRKEEILTDTGGGGGAPA